MSTTHTHPTTTQAAQVGLDIAADKAAKAAKEAADNAALLATLTERLGGLSARYTQACEAGKVGYSDFLLARMEIASKRIRELMAGQPCCEPYPTARHTSRCATLTHVPLLFADPGSGLTACGLVWTGPMAAPGEEPTCDGCTTRPIKPGAFAYPDVLMPLSAREYDLALEEARIWLLDNVGDTSTSDGHEAWKVWTRLDASYRGGVSAFIDSTRPRWAEA